MICFIIYMFQMISYFIYCTFICCLPVPEVGSKKGDTSQEILKNIPFVPQLFILE